MGGRVCRSESRGVVSLSGLGEGTSAAPEGVLVVLPCSRALTVRPQVCSRVAFQLTCSRQEARGQCWTGSLAFGQRAAEPSAASNPQ